MSAAKHTPGPWDARDIDDEYSERQFWISDVEGGLVAEAAVSAGDAVDANARLIAAAPELLAALREFVSQHEAVDPEGLFDGLEMFRARAAIAKATGEAA